MYHSKSQLDVKLLFPTLFILQLYYNYLLTQYRTSFNKLIYVKFTVNLVIYKITFMINLRFITILIFQITFIL